MQFHPVLVPLHLRGCGECEVCVLRFKGSVKSNHLFCICVLHPRFGFGGKHLLNDYCFVSTATACSPLSGFIYQAQARWNKRYHQSWPLEIPGTFLDVSFYGKMCSPADVSFMLRWSDFSLSGKRLRDGRNLNFLPHPLFVICTSLWSSCCGVYCPDGCTEAKGTCNMLHRFQHLRSPIKAKRLI